MSQADKHSKTEEASPKRLRDSRKKGQVAKSGDLNSAISFLLFAVLLSSLGAYLLKNIMAFQLRTLRLDFSEVLNFGNVGKILGDALFQFFLIFLPFGLLAVVIGVFSNLVQVGFLFTMDPLKPDFKKLNPMEGFKNIFSKKSMNNLFKSLMKLGIVVGITYNGLKDIIVPIMNSGKLSLNQMFTFFMNIVQDLSISIAMLMIVLGLLDLVFLKKDHKKNLMMTLHEVKEEYKQMEGDPKIKSKRQQKQREMSMARTMEGVRDSTVVITNPTHIAIAIRYDQEKDQAPVVMAKGLDFLAQKMKEEAKKNDIPIIENKPLARTMYYQVEPGSMVPLELYQAMAEVLALVYTMNNNKNYY